MGAKTVKFKKDLGDLAGLATTLKQQADAGEVDANLIDQLSEGINVAVDQAGNVHDEAVEEAKNAASNLGQEVQAAPDAAAAVSEPVNNDAGDTGDTGETGEEEEEVKKVYSSRPGISTLVPGSAEEDLRQLIPEFTKALNSGSIRKAQELVNKSQQAFDKLLTMSCMELLSQGGIVYKNINRIHMGAPDELDLKKGITSATGFSGVYLQRLAKLMMPVYAGMRRRIPANPPEQAAVEAMWRTQIGFQNLDKSALLSIGEADTGEEISETPFEFKTPFRDITLNDKVTLKAIATSRGYDDPLQIAIIRVMTAILEAGERKVIGDNKAAIAKPATVTVASASTGGSLGAATYTVRVSALTYIGWLAQSKGGTGAKGETDATAASGATVTGTTNKLDVTWDAVPGAVAYNVFIDNATNNRYVGTFTVPKCTITAFPGSGNAPSATNVSANANGYEGILNWCALSTIYGNTIPNKKAMVDNAGGTLSVTASGISEIDAVLAWLWSTWNIAPTALLTSPLMVGNLTDKILGMNNGASYRIEVSQERGNIQGGMMISGYVNKYAAYADGSPRFVDVIPHPYLPDGTLNLLCETIPYPTSRENRGFAIETLIPYTYFPLAASRIEYPFAVTQSEVLECFHPAAQVQISGVALG